MIKRAKGRTQKVVMNKYRAMKGSATSTGVNDVVVVNQDDDFLKASPLQVYIKVTANMRMKMLQAQQTMISKILIR